MEVWVLSVGRIVHDIFTTAGLAKRHYENVIADRMVIWESPYDGCWITPEDNQIVIKSYVVVAQ